MKFLEKLARMYLVLMLLVVTAIIFFLMQMKMDKDNIAEKSFLVNTDACRIPDLNPFDTSISKYVNPKRPFKCDGKPSITYEDGDTVRIDFKVIENSYKTFNSCKYQAISRGPKLSDSNVQFGHLTESFSADVKVSDEFIRIHCYDKYGKKIYTNYHTFVTQNSSVEATAAARLKSHQVTNDPLEVLSVMMIGVDSVSRLNFMRTMPKTREYLLQDLQAVEMLGYTKVADNTFVNIVPMTIGKFVEELPWNESLKNKPFDKYNFIWKNFSQCGYRTLYAEDAPEIAIFNYLKTGFAKKPAHHYNRAFSLAMEKDSSVWSNGHHCVRDRLEADVVLNYACQFATTYIDKPHFGFTFITRLTHDDVNSAGAADEPYRRFFERINKERLLENTTLIFFSDHGMRFGDIRSTYVGKVEERMPFMFFVFPQWFKEKYPHVIKSIQTNSNRLTTPFDIHETLKDILYFKGEVKRGNTANRGISLFNHIPLNRTCESAGILPHWCMCLDREDLPKNSKQVISSVNLTIKTINEKLQKHNDVCEILKLKDITKAVKMVANSEVLRFTKSVNDVIDRKVHYGERTKALALLQLTLSTKPGGGMFEATVHHDENKDTYSMAGEISRINKYGNQSACVNNFELKKYCYCKNIS